MSTTKELFTCRRVLSIMVFTCFVFYQMLKVNISIALVNMTKYNSTKQTSSTSGYFLWSEKEKADILSAFYWGQVLVALPGGRLSELYGSRLVLGVSFFLASILTIVTPLLAHLHYYAVLVSRVGIGLVLGAAQPMILPLAVRWVSPTNISKFLSHTSSVYLGGALTMPVCGYLITNFGWKSVFYATGTTSLVWTCCWFYLVYDSPARHPRISSEEKEAIFAKVSWEEERTGKNIPWRKILGSKPIWAQIVASSAVILSVNIAFNYLPSYMDEVLHFNVEINGLVGSLPYLASYATTVLSSYMADKWLKIEKFKTFTIRRIFLVLTLGGSAFIFVFLLFFGDKPTLSVIAFILWFSFSGCSTPCVVANSIDLAPNYSGTVTGICYTINCLVVYVEGLFIAYMTQVNNTFEQWKYIFWLMISGIFFGIVLFFLFGSSDVQSFNSAACVADVEIDNCLESKNFNISNNF